MIPTSSKGRLACSTGFIRRPASFGMPQIPRRERRWRLRGAWVPLDHCRTRPVGRCGACPLLGYCSTCSTKSSLQVAGADFVTGYGVTAKVTRSKKIWPPGHRPSFPLPPGRGYRGSTYLGDSAPFAVTYIYICSSFVSLLFYNF
jgi:hypothetical protein